MQSLYFFKIKRYFYTVKDFGIILKNGDCIYSALKYIKILYNIAKYKNKINQLNPSRSNNKVAIFTAISNNYDSIPLPLFINKEFDYFLFTNSSIKDTGIWKLRPMNYISCQSVNSARFIKTHPHILLKKYDIAIWIDPNITILDNIAKLVKKFIKSKMVAGIITNSKGKIKKMI